MKTRHIYTVEMHEWKVKPSSPNDVQKHVMGVYGSHFKARCAAIDLIYGRKINLVWKTLDSLTNKYDPETPCITLLYRNTLIKGDVQMTVEVHKHVVK